jgi:hypothetical protein
MCVSCLLVVSGSGVCGVDGGGGGGGGGGGVGTAAAAAGGGYGGGGDFASLLPTCPACAPSTTLRRCARRVMRRARRRLHLRRRPRPPGRPTCPPRRLRPHSWTATRSARATPRSRPRRAENSTRMCRARSCGCTAPRSAAAGRLWCTWVGAAAAQCTAKRACNPSCSPHQFMCPTCTGNVAAQNGAVGDALGWCAARDVCVCVFMYSCAGHVMVYVLVCARCARAQVQQGSGRRRAARGCAVQHGHAVLRWRPRCVHAVPFTLTPRTRATHMPALARTHAHNTHIYTH